MVYEVKNIPSGSPIRFLDVCSGIGTMRIGLEQNGWQCVGRFETDPIADSIYHSVFGTSEPNFNDVRTLPLRLPDFDILVANIPGSTYSQVYNKGKRPDTSIPFGILGLLSHYRPKGFLLECVPGFANPKCNPNYSLFLSMLKSLGYDVEAGIYSAQTYGLPLDTKRFVMIGLLMGIPRITTMTDLNEVRLEHCLIDTHNSELDTSSKEWGEYLAKATKGPKFMDFHALDDYTIIDRRQTDVRVYHNVCPPFRCANHGLFYVKDGHIKRITAYEGLLMHGVPRNIAHKIKRFPISEHRLLSYVGTAAPVPMMEGISKWVETAIYYATTKAA